MTLLNDWASRLTCMPTREALEASSRTADSIQSVPLAYIKVNFSGAPAAIPAPQSPGAVPGRMQVSIRLGFTDQPCARSSCPALGMFSVHWSPFCASCGDRYCVAGYVDTGPIVALP